MRAIVLRNGFAPLAAATSPVDTSANETSGASAPVKAGFKLRFKAWWEGVYVEDLIAASALEDEPVNDNAAKRAPDKASSSSAAAPEDEAPPPPWDAARIKAVEAICGDGHLWPGESDMGLRFARPMALSPALNLMDLRAGLGGFPRTVVDTFGLWVDGFEQDKVLAEAAQRRSEFAGMGKKASVRHFNPEADELRVDYYDAAMAREFFCRVDDKMGVFRKVHQALKTPAQLMLTDLVLADNRELGETAKAWLAAETDIVKLETIDDYRTMCDDVDLDIHICEDYSDEYHQAVLAGWAKAIQQFRPGVHERDVQLDMLTEAERWMLRLASIKSGDVRVIRIHAYKKKAPLG